MLFLYKVKTARLARRVVSFAFARKRVSPAIAFSAIWFLRQRSGLIGFVSSLSRLACQQVSHIGKRDRQVGFVGCGFFGCGVLPAVIS